MKIEWTLGIVKIYSKQKIVKTLFENFVILEPWNEKCSEGTLFSMATPHF
jgi:hypothetical protein